MKIAYIEQYEDFKKVAKVKKKKEIWILEEKCIDRHEKIKEMVDGRKANSK